MAAWVHLVHDEIGGSTRIPADAPDVLEQHEARGWRVVDDVVDEDQALSLPRADDAPAGAGEGAWVDLVHPELDGATQRVPNHRDALQAAFDAGWQYPEPPADAVREELREIRGGKGGRPRAEERAQAEERAAAAAAATDEPPEPAGPGDQSTAGDGTQQEE